MLTRQPTVKFTLSSKNLLYTFSFFSVKPGEFIAVGMHEKCGVKGCSVEVIFEATDKKPDVRRIFINPQSATHVEFVKAMATYCGLLTSPCRFTRTRNDEQHLVGNSQVHGNIGVFPDKVKLANYGREYKARPFLDFLAERY